MSYCVNCGVELGHDLKECPLCHTPVINPSETPSEDELPFFPTRSEDVQPVSKTELALLLTAMLASVSLLCGVVNLFVGSFVAWSLYIAGAAVMLWIWFVLPLLTKKMPGWPRLAIDVCAVAVYVFLIALALGGLDWYLGLAMPVLLSAAAVVLLESWLMRGRRHSILVSIVMILMGVGIFSAAAEVCFDLFLLGEWRPGWSIVVLAVCVGLCIPLIVVRFVPSLREEARRRFHM